MKVTVRRFAKWAGPWGAMTPNSARWHRSALIAWVRWRTSKSRVRPEARVPRAVSWNVQGFFRENLDLVRGAVVS